MIPSCEQSVKLILRNELMGIAKSIQTTTFQSSADTRWTYSPSSLTRTMHFNPSREGTERERVLLNSPRCMYGTARQAFLMLFFKLIRMVSNQKFRNRPSREAFT